MRTTVEAAAPERLADADLRPRGAVHPSPATWRDQTLYFLLPDRFSDGGEADRPVFDRADPTRFGVADRAGWSRAGKDWQGGTLRGAIDKLDYLRDLGITTLWLGPVWRQRPELDTYHGYGIQHFLDVDPRFGSRRDLRDLVDAAHDRGMYVLLDIIYNHSGNNWFYRTDDGGLADERPYRFEPPYAIGAWRSRDGSPVDHVTRHDDGVWPQEFQRHDWYTRAGSIGRWDAEGWEDPEHDHTEFRRGDFYSLKDLELLRGPVLSAVIRVYQYWIALTDCDGFRIDTVKHVPLEASRSFCGALHEYAESIGKENFLLLGEVTGGARMARAYLDILGRNIDAALDIGDPAERLSGMVKGFADARGFFDLYTGRDLLGSHRETGRYHVSVLDDHDMVGRAKRRFAAGLDGELAVQQVAAAVGTQLTTLGIPCIYYGTEQAFDGGDDDHLPELGGGHEDRYLRESMFGGTFGAFRTAGCHFFDRGHPTYRRIAAVARLRNGRDDVGMALRRGRMYPRETSVLGRPFEHPAPGELVAWSRIQHDREVVVALNSHGREGRGGHVTVDASLHPPGTDLTYRYRSDWTGEDLAKVPETAGGSVVVEGRGGRSTAWVELPPGGMAVLA